MSGTRDLQRRAWLAVAFWTALVLTLSSDGFGAAGTSRILLPLLRLLLPSASEETLALVHGAVRKAAHVTEYALLGALTLRALAQGAARTVARPGVRAALLAFAYAAFVAGVDETRQSLSTERTGTPRDVALDAAGAVAGIGAVQLAARGFGRRLAG